MTYTEELKFWVQLLTMEVSALRSVLSEFEGDKSHFVQMQKADAIDAFKNTLKRV